MNSKMLTCWAVSVIGLFLFASQSGAATFTMEQNRYERYRSAVAEKEKALKLLFRQQGVSYPPQDVFLRAFKQERKLELWAKDAKNVEFKKIRTYDFCAVSGKLGPKRREGDLQIPEGFYHIDRFNPASKFHLSLGINYPNASDRIRSDKQYPGGDIFIHGSCVTIGCIPVTDDKIKEIYIAAVAARSNGQSAIPVHIFPSRLNQDGFDKLQGSFSRRQDLLGFWQELKVGFDYFERHRKLPRMHIDKNGKYLFSSEGLTEIEKKTQEIASGAREASRVNARDVQRPPVPSDQQPHGSGGLYAGCRAEKLVFCKRY
ncbi:murein L,D-transpeptidase family protein [Acidobacteriota bacterium]